MFIGFGSIYRTPGQINRQSTPSSSDRLGPFIYASTVIRYIQSPKHRPDDRLEVIIRLLSSQEGDQPYAQLDALCGLIFGSVERLVQLERICLVLVSVNLAFPADAES